MLASRFRGSFGYSAQPLLLWFAAFGLPPLCCLLAPTPRELSLLAVEAVWICGTICFVFLHGRPLEPRSLGLCLSLVLCGVADVSYNLLPVGAARYPYHIGPDLLFLSFTWSLLILLSPRPQLLRPGFFFDLGVWVATALFALALQSRFVLAPMLSAGTTPPYAWAVAWLSAISSAGLLGAMIVDTMRTPAWPQLGLGLGVLLMLTSDFAQRHDATAPIAPTVMGASEVAFEMGLGLMCISLMVLLRSSRPAEVSDEAAPLRSARMAVGLSGPVGNALLIVGGIQTGVLALSDATDVNRILALAWLGWALSHAVGVALGQALDGLSRRLATDSRRGTAAIATSVPLHPLPREPAFFAELSRWAEHYNRLIARINPVLDGQVMASASVASEVRSEQVLHDMRAPLTIIWQAAHALTPSSSDAAEPQGTQGAHDRWLRLLKEATVRLGTMSERLLAPTQRQRHALGCRARLGPLLTAAWQEFMVRQAHRSQDQWLLCPPPVTEIWLIAEREVVLMALSNVLDNAAEAREQNAGVVTLAWESDRHTARIIVHDDGPGFSRDHRHRLGRERVASRKQGGSGLGLRNTVELLRPFGGTLSFSSPADSWTRVTLEFRRAF